MEQAAESSNACWQEKKKEKEKEKKDLLLLQEEENVRCMVGCCLAACLWQSLISRFGRLSCYCSKPAGLGGWPWLASWRRDVDRRAEVEEDVFFLFKGLDS